MSWVSGTSVKDQLHEKGVGRNPDGTHAERRPTTKTSEPVYKPPPPAPTTTVDDTSNNTVDLSKDVPGGGVDPKTGNWGYGRNDPKSGQANWGESTPTVIDKVKHTLHLSNSNTPASAPHASYQGPNWPDRNAGVVRWLFTGIVWAGGYTVFTYEDFVKEWRDWDGTLWTLFEPHRLFRTVVTVGVTVSLTYVLPFLEVVFSLLERLYEFIKATVQWTREGWNRFQREWAWLHTKLSGVSERL